MNFRRPIAALWAALLLLVASACGGGGDPARAEDAGAGCPAAPLDATPSLPAPDVARDGAAVSGPDVPLGQDSGSDTAFDSIGDTGGAVAWALPPCETACDRFVDCAVWTCQGFDWATSGLIAGECHAACDDAFVAAVAAASDCDAVLEGPGAGVGVLGELCDENPCSLACGRLASCVVAECPALDAPVEGPIRDDCVRTCDPESISWISRYPTCADLVGTIAGADPGFAEACSGVATECADVADCEPYADRVTACLVETCGAAMAPYESGVRWAMAEFCRNAEPCASARDVALYLDPVSTCADPPFGDLGHNPPFAGICEGTSGVGADAVRAACDAVFACAGTEWLPDVEACMALVGLRDDAAALTGCVRAADGCGEVFGCFEEAGG